MEANFFRYAAAELFELIKGLSLNKVFSPCPGVWTFSFGSARNLVFYCLPKGGGFFLSKDKPPNPSNPSAEVMWLRKRLKNRRILDLINAWPLRKMAISMSGMQEHLVLDTIKGVSIVSDLGPLVHDPPWPDLDDILSNKDIWKTHPHLTPVLRNSLEQMNAHDGQVLLDTLSQGQVREFYVIYKETGGHYLSCFKPPGAKQYKSFGSAIEAAQFYCLPKVYELTGNVSVRRKDLSRQQKRLDKNLNKVLKDRQRLMNMVDEARLGELIKNNLYRLDAHQKTESIDLPDWQGHEEKIMLNSALSIKENMEKYFKRAAKGKRGLDFVSKREKELREQLDNLQSAPLPDLTVFSRGPKSKHLTRLDKKLTGIAVKKFRSTNGFIIIRAKNSESGHKLLSYGAAAHDLWMHVQGGPGAHVIIKRDHGLQEVPESCLKEAATLAALSSYRKNDDRAEVYLASVKDVRKVKGLGQGRVLMDGNVRTIIVNIDPFLESKLHLGKAEG
ncbi:NFACT RNA binding domain-containing protein [Desulfonatronovibrio magnus]|uniref:NFACT RNA binding domain-containing protein n=1 Tax=Desulfonatronovibrio magnus TaxID=698827 RepID=UPI0012FC8BC1|nr:NFACT RNA binding domain-containing protein [Desulfonatronovibrio magnus]